MTKRAMTKRLNGLFVLALALVMLVGLSAAALAATYPEQVLSLGGSIVWHGPPDTGTAKYSRIGIVDGNPSNWSGSTYDRGHVFDIKLQYVPKGSAIQTCYHDIGYASAGVVGSDIRGGRVLNAGGTTDIGSGVRVTMRFTGVANATILKLDYIVENTSGASRTVSVGGTVDVCIARDEYAKISEFSNADGAKGLISQARSGEFLSFNTDGNYWYGRWSGTQYSNFKSFIYKAGHEDNRTGGGYDSSMSWQWQGFTVPAGETVTKT